MLNFGARMQEKVFFCCLYLEGPVFSGVQVLLRSRTALSLLKLPEGLLKTNEGFFFLFVFLAIHRAVLSLFLVF